MVLSAPSDSYCKEAKMRFVLLAFCCCMCGSGCYLDRVYRCDDCAGAGYSGRFRSLATASRCEQCTGQSSPCRDCLTYTLSARASHMLTCGSGCQDVYVDEWLSDPPAACDPCDNHGNWTGAADPCCGSDWSTFWTHLWGERLPQSSCCGGQGCASCAAPGTDVIWQDGPPPVSPKKSSGSPSKRKPTPAKKKPVRPRPANQ